MNSAQADAGGDFTQKGYFLVKMPIVFCFATFSTLIVLPLIVPFNDDTSSASSEDSGNINTTG